MTGLRIVLGVDIGGTKIAAGLVDEDARVIAAHTLPARAAEGFEISIEQVWSAIDQSITRDVSAIGICAPGPLNPKTGIIMTPPNLPGWRDVPLVEMAAARYRLPVTLENDCNAAGLAEVRCGAARGLSNVFYAAIGTGIGSAIIIDGKIYHGKNGVAGEAGHMTIDYRSSTICGCGTPGCIEALASGTAIDIHAIDLEQLVERLSAWLGAIVSLLDPEMIVIGGGVAQSNEPLFEKLRVQVPMRTVNPFAKSIPIVPAHFGSRAGIVGAALIARELIHADSAA